MKIGELSINGSQRRGRLKENDLRIIRRYEEMVIDRKIRKVKINVADLICVGKRQKGKVKEKYIST